MVVARPSQGHATQLCIWLIGFCTALMAVIMVTSERSCPSPSVHAPDPDDMHAPDPNYFAKRCSERRTGLFWADLPFCPDGPPAHVRLVE